MSFNSLDDLVQYIRLNKQEVTDKTGWSFCYSNSIWTLAHNVYFKDDKSITEKQIKELVKNK